MKLTCYHCAKQINGAQKMTVPAQYMLNLGLDFVKSYHPACYQKAEKLAEKSLRAKCA
jgi:hypothetical protein